MNIWIFILLIVAGIALVLLELFIIPGVGLAGIGGCACLVGSVVYAYTVLGPTAGHITTAVVVVLTSVAIYIFFKIRAIEKLGSDATIDEKVELADPGKKIKRLQEDAHANDAEVKSAAEPKEQTSAKKDSAETAC